MFIAKKELPFVDTIESYEGFLQEANYSAETIANRLSLIHRVNESLTQNYGTNLSSAKVEEVKGYMLDNIMRDIKVSPETKIGYIQIVKYFFGWLKSSGYTQSDASEVLVKPKIVRDDDDPDQEERKAYSPDEALDLILLRVGPAVDKRDRAITAALLGGGFRASEICWATVGEFRNRKNGKVHIRRKGGARRWVAVADFAITYIEEYLAERRVRKPDEPLFTSLNGRGLTRAEIWQRMRVRQEKLGLETGVHKFRHTYLSEIDRSAPRDITQKAAGHRNSDTTKRYVHPERGAVQRATNNTSWARALAEKEGANELD